MQGTVLLIAYVVVFFFFLNVQYEIDEAAKSMSFWTLLLPRVLVFHKQILLS